MLVAICLLAACNTATTQQEVISSFYAPATGTLVVADSMRIVEDELNELYYTVRISSTAYSDTGAYTLDMAYGYNEAQSNLIYPKIKGHIHPAVQIDSTKPYSYNLGFFIDSSKEFKHYAQATATKLTSTEYQIKFNYIKTYYIDTIKAE